MSEKSAYRFTGAKGQGEIIDRIIIEGSSSDPKVVLELGGEIELTEAEAVAFRNEYGVNLKKLQGNSDDPVKLPDTDGDDDEAKKSHKHGTGK